MSCRARGRILEADAVEGDAILYRFRNWQGIGGLLDPGLQIKKHGRVYEEEIVLIEPGQGADAVDMKLLSAKDAAPGHGTAA